MEENTDFVTFTEEILNGELPFFAQWTYAQGTYDWYFPVNIYLIKGKTGNTRTIEIISNFTAKTPEYFLNTFS